MATFIFGITVGGVKAFVFYLCVEFIALILVCLFFAVKGKAVLTRANMIDYIETLIFSLVAVLVSILFYLSANKASPTLIKEYDTIVTDVSYHRGFDGTVWFSDPDGEEQFADFEYWQIISMNDEKTVLVGDKVHIKEMKGSFDIEYNVVDGKVD